MRYQPLLACLLSIPSSLLASTCLAQPLAIGHAETVVPLVDSDTAGVVSQLQDGSVIFQDGLIHTYKIGAAGLRFSDQTTLTVYPNSSIKLDRFVYNPDKTVSEVALTLTRGAFRLASGGPHPPDKYKLRTPYVTLGIRGTVIHVYSDDNATVVEALYGAFEGCSTISGVCILVKATDAANGAKFWKDGRVERGRFPATLGVRTAWGSGSVTPSSGELGFQLDRVGPQGPGSTQTMVMPTAVRPDFPRIQGSTQPPNTEGAICFIRGTRITTRDGDKRIEDLRIGDEVLTRTDGFQKVRWIPKQIFRRERGHRWGSWIAPILIEADAIGENCPSAQLLISPNHSVFVEDILIPAWLLINGKSIRQIDFSGLLLEYFNLELDKHQVIYANGVPVETFRARDDRDREHWSNFSDYSLVYPGEEYRTVEPIAPVLFGRKRRLLGVEIWSGSSPKSGEHEVLERVRQRLALREKTSRTARLPA